jgi:hypothetical protein
MKNKVDAPITIPKEIDFAIIPKTDIMTNVKYIKGIKE